VGIWPRGGGKSTTAEAACVAVGARDVRGYALYISETQDQADKHVESIGTMLESPEFGRAYPLMADRAVNKYGSSKGWRRNRLTTASGFTVDAIGLDTGARGIKREDQRPDFMIVDDIDGRHDTAATTAKKASTLTDTLLPAGSTDLAVLAVQNLIHTDSIFSQLADGRADFLATRTISGPFPAVHDLAYAIRDGRAIVTGGTPLWAGQDLAAVQHQIDTYGLSAVLRESQQEVRRDPDAALWKRAWIADHRVPASPQLARLVVGVDPSGSARGDEVGVIAAGIDLRGHAYIVGDASLHGSPDAWARAAIELWHAQKGDRIIAEANFGLRQVREQGWLAGTAYVEGTV